MYYYSCKENALSKKGLRRPRATYFQSPQKVAPLEIWIPPFFDEIDQQVKRWPRFCYNTLREKSSPALK